MQGLERRKVPTQIRIQKYQRNIKTYKPKKKKKERKQKTQKINNFDGRQSGGRRHVGAGHRMRSMRWRVDIEISFSQ
jgi:hypothetical protein